MITISTDFESGNIGVWSLVEPRKLHFHAPMDQGLYAMWFYFRIEGAGPGPFECVITNLHECLGTHDWVHARPVYRAQGGSWQRVASPPQVDFAQDTFRFQIELTDQPVEVAYCYPYTPGQQLQSLLDELTQHTGVRVHYPVQSEAGRPVPYLTMDCLGDDAYPKTIWAIGREHAGEVSGAYTLDGFLRAIVDSPLRQHYTIHALPMIAYDAVMEGWYGKVVPPADYWIGWFADSPRPEIRFMMQQVAATAAAGKTPELLLTFHSPTAENNSYVVVPNPTLLNADQRNRMGQLAYWLKTKAGLHADEATFMKSHGWRLYEGEEAINSGWISASYGAIGCTVESSYHIVPNGCMGAPDQWRQMGEQVADAVRQHLLTGDSQMIDVYGSLPPTVLDNHGWKIWQLPHGCTIELTPTEARLRGYLETAVAYIGMPEFYALDDFPDIAITFAPPFDTTYPCGGVVRVTWLTYDKQGWRLFLSPLESVIPIGPEQTLALPSWSDERIAYVRPSFRLSGTFGEFAVQIRPC